MALLWQVGNLLCEKVYQHEFVQNLIHSDTEKFDVMVIGAFFNDCVIGLAHKLRIPVIQMCSLVGTKWMDAWVGNPSFYSYVPNTFQEFTSKMTFRQRVSNTVSELYVKLGREIYFLPKQNAIMKKYFNSSDDFPTIEELQNNISLVLVNSHFSFNLPRPLMPNMIEVGGLHVKSPKKLPTVSEEIQFNFNFIQHRFQGHLMIFTTITSALCFSLYACCIHNAVQKSTSI